MSNQPSISPEERIAELSDEGFFILDAIKRIRMEYSVSLGQAKEMVTAHPCYTQVHAANEPLHDTVLESLLLPFDQWPDVDLSENPLLSVIGRQPCTASLVEINEGPPIWARFPDFNDSPLYWSATRKDDSRGAFVEIGVGGYIGAVFDATLLLLGDNRQQTTSDLTYSNALLVENTLPICDTSLWPPDADVLEGKHYLRIDISVTCIIGRDYVASWFEYPAQVKTVYRVGTVDFCVNASGLIAGVVFRNVTKEDIQLFSTL